MSRRSDIVSLDSLRNNNQSRSLSPESAAVKFDKLNNSDLFSFSSATPYKFSVSDVFVLTHGKIHYNFEEERIEFDQRHVAEELESVYGNNFKNLDELAASIEFLELLMNSMADGLFYDIDSFINTKVEKAKISVPVKNQVNGYYSYSPYRYEHESMEEFLFDLVKSLLISTFLAKIADETENLRTKSPYFYRELPAKLSKIAPESTASLFARDVSFTVDGKLYYPQTDFFDNHYKTKSFSLENNIEITRQDFDSEIEDAEFAPFLLQGGNIVVDENRKIILYQDCLHELRGEISQSEENAFYQTINDWAKRHGYHPIMIERDFSKTMLTFEDLYHLDVYLNVIGQYVIVPDEKILSEKTRNDLAEFYGEENMIYLSQEEREEFCTNFITFGNKVVMTSPSTPQSFIDKLTIRGFDVVIPPLMLSRSSNSGVRCYTQVAPDSMLENDRKETRKSTMIRVDEKPVQDLEYKVLPKLSTRARVAQNIRAEEKNSEQNI